MTGKSQERIEPNLASLIGGIIVGVAVLSLWCAIAGELGGLSPAVLIAGIVVSIATAMWIRLANL